jgi:hypothetical protein
MSWDVFLFNTKQKVETIEEIDEDVLEPIDFCSIFEHHFSKIGRDDNYREIKGDDFSIGYFVDECPVSNKMLMLHGENALYAIIQFAKISVKNTNGWFLTLILANWWIWNRRKETDMGISERTSSK